MIVDLAELCHISGSQLYFDSESTDAYARATLCLIAFLAAAKSEPARQC
jgi:hypothetical protein